MYDWAPDEATDAEIASAVDTLWHDGVISDNLLQQIADHIGWSRESSAMYIEESRGLDR